LGSTLLVDAGFSPEGANLREFLEYFHRSYRAETSQNTNGTHSQIVRTSVAVPSSVVLLEMTLTAWIRSCIEERGGNYQVRGTAGQVNRRFTLIPYITILRPEITLSPNKGLYIVLLFHQELDCVWLSLNQGFQQFSDRYGLRGARTALANASNLLSLALSPIPGFQAGPIDLGASYPFGKGYEAGAIVSKRYELPPATDIAEQLRTDLNRLLDLYDSVNAELAGDPAVAGLFGSVNEAVYQEQANKLSATVKMRLVDAPRRPVSNRIHGSTERYPRNPAVAAAAIHHAGHTCEARCGIPMFLSAATGLIYVEAHHLVPLYAQPQFSEASLDVYANVVALCPACHAKIHRGSLTAREPLISRLFTDRQSRLDRAGIAISLATLGRLY
jgi:5-methylcytosine-specific restriction enzyme A